MFSKARFIGAAVAIATLAALGAPAVSASAHPTANYFSYHKSINLPAGPPHLVGATPSAPSVTRITYYALDGDNGAADQYLHVHCDASCAAYVTACCQSWGFVNPGQWYYLGTWRPVWEVQLYGNGDCLTYVGLTAEFVLDPCSSGNRSQWFYFPNNQIRWFINAQGSINAGQFVYMTERHASPGSVVVGEISGAANRAVWLGLCNVNC
jgi:hypothetical protein